MNERAQTFERWTAALIARRLHLGFFHRKHMFVVPNCYFTGHEADLLVVHENLKLIDVEIKISRADLKADLGKDKWWRRFPSTYAGEDENGRSKFHSPAPLARDWPPKIWRHYYVMPAEIWRADLLDALPRRSGVITMRSPDTFGWEVVRRAQPDPDAKPIAPADAFHLGRLSNLRMWEALCR